MRSRLLGKTGLEVKVLGFGGIPIQRVSEEEAIEVVRRCYELGINYYDTARAYTVSEERIGKALEDIRENVILATKSGRRDGESLLRELETSLTGEVQPRPLPRVFALHGNYPNPFNPATTIAFDLPSAQPVKLVIYGLDGRRVRQLVSGNLPPGRHEVVWRGRDDQRRTVAAGTYLYRVQAGSWSATGKLNLVK